LKTHCFTSSQAACAHQSILSRETWKRVNEKKLKYGYSLSVPLMHCRISGSTRDSKFLQMIHKYLQADIISKNGCSRLLQNKRKQGELIILMKKKHFKAQHIPLNKHFINLQRS